MKAVKQGANFAMKLAKLKENQESFDYNLLDISHPDFNTIEKKCMPVQGFTQVLRNEILNLKTHSEVSGRVNLAANQIGIHKRFMVMVKPEYQQKRLWVNHDLEISQIHALINPKILDKDKFIEYDWEETACFPTLRFRKARFHHIYVQYLNENMEQIEAELNGWESRLFQHSLDHLNGMIPFDEVQNMLDSELLPEYNEDKLKLDEFKDSHFYGLFAKDKKTSFSAHQGKYGPQSIPETIHERKADQQPQISYNKTKKQKPSK